MKFKERLLQGTLIKRYKRFFVDIKYKDKIITSHCPNPGSMMGLLDNNNKVWFSVSDNPKRKLKYTLEMIEVKKKKVGINTLLTNKIILESLNYKKINIDYVNLIREKAGLKKIIVKDNLSKEFYLEIYDYLKLQKFKFKLIKPHKKLNTKNDDYFKYYKDMVFKPDEKKKI